MECDWAVICDYALTAQDGKVSVIGMYDAIMATAFPATHPTMAAVFRLRAIPNATEPVKVEVARPNGDVLHGFEGNITIGATGVFTLIVNVVGLTFPEEGRYSFRVLTNNRLLKSVALRLHRVHPGGPAPPMPTAGTIH